MNKDLIVKLPFVLSGNERKDGAGACLGAAGRAR